MTASSVTSADNKRYYFYSPELNLISETATTTSATPPVAYDYVWFNGEPLAQINHASGEVSYYFNDHLGTPILQTNQAAQVVWRAEYEPYGQVFSLRAGEGRHRPLRLPGQEAEQFESGPNGVTERSYNIFRWYRSGWGRYTTADPIGLRGDVNLYRYANDNPNAFVDRTGLKCSKSCPDCPGGTWITYGLDLGFTLKLGFAGFGGSMGFFNARCLSSQKRCTYFVMCSKLFGAGAYIGLNGGVGGSFNAKCASDIEGIQWGVEVDAAKEVGGSFSTDVSPSGSWGMKGGGGLGEGLSGTFNLCEVKGITCN
ncbi:MAG TPA: RHS repeat-associated core domain-containing protein [Thermoanaerobaculia bacterium]|nr:RHS repeat-associated core domain-containing protein [Thermoanaerobaculia bacterium]